VEIDGYLIWNVLVDGGSRVNMMLESTTFGLGHTIFESTNQVLRMANQSQVIHLGKLFRIYTQIYNMIYSLNYVVIRVGIGKPFSLLLRRPWLYAVGVKVN
jgi:hypothetical protein